MTNEEKKQKELRDDRITVHPGEFTIEAMTSSTHSLTSEEYRQLMINQLQEMKEMLKKKRTTGKKTFQMNSGGAIKGSIFGFAVADALGVPIEFESRTLLNKKPLKAMVGYGSHAVPEGTWSDDTSMTIATIDSIVETNKIDYNDMMKKFCDWYLNSKYTATGVLFDIGISTRKALNNYCNGVSALQCGGIGEFDNGNGSLMRILPIVLYSYYNHLSEDQEVELLNSCSSLTHGHEISRLGCKIYCDFIKSLLDGSTKEQAFQSLSNNKYSNYYSIESVTKYNRILTNELINLDVNKIKSSGFVIDTLEASIWSILTTNSYEEAVVRAVNLGEDTDTIGAITGSIAGIIYGYNSIPIKWTSKIKNKDYLLKLIDSFNDYLCNKSIDKKAKKVGK